MGIEGFINRLLIEVKFSDKKTSESCADFFLTPARYLFNGKKVDYIQSNHRQACQIAPSYEQGQKDYLMTTLMVIAVIPGTILGLMTTIYANYRYQNSERESFIQSNVIGQESQHFYKVITLPEELTFGEEVTHYINLLSGETNLNSFKKSGSTLFLSEIQNLRLRRDALNSEGSKNPKTLKCNRAILENIHLLWNLRFVNLSDHYVDNRPSKEEGALRSINPSVGYLIYTRKYPTPQGFEMTTANEFFDELKRRLEGV